MKIPAIRSKIGVWVYYVATLTFGEVAEYVKRVDDELHKSEVLSEMLQRSITNNYKSISNYILKQEERFFNSLVLAVYDGDPQWHEIRLNYGDGKEFYDLGLLELTGREKIFPVDGQHRVEGIKDAIISNPKLISERIPVIFIGHKKDPDGMQRARRLFSTLNRYAKPVSMSDIIALDEDDIIAIICRTLIDNHILFADKRIVNSKTKAIPESNLTAFTSIITFYECNRELLKYYLDDFEIKDHSGKKLRGNAKLTYFIKFRPDDEKINDFTKLCFDYWDAFKNGFEEINQYVESKKQFPAEEFRNKQGGSILFRPIALLPFVKASLKIKKYFRYDNKILFRKMYELPLNLNSSVWHGVLWNPISQTMITNYQSFVELILLYLFDNKLLTEREKGKFSLLVKATYKEDITKIFKRYKLW